MCMSIEHKILMGVLLVMLALFALAGGYFYGVQQGYTLRQDGEDYTAVVRKRLAPRSSSKLTVPSKIPSATSEFLGDIPPEVKLDGEFKNLDKDIQELQKRKTGTTDPKDSLFGAVIEYIAPDHP